MSMKILEKIDKFYLILILVLGISGAIVVFTFRGIFASILTAYEIDLQTGSNDFKIEKEKQDQASASFYERQQVKLEIRDEIKSPL